MKNGKLFGKISVIDLAVIVLVILLLTAAVIRLGFFSTPDQAIQSTQKEAYETVEREITLLVQHVNAQMLSDPFVVGDTLMISKKPFGKIMDIKREHYAAATVLEDGTTVTVNDESAYNYIIKVKASLLRKKGFLRTSKNDIVAVGETLNILSEYFHGNAIVADIK